MRFITGLAASLLLGAAAPAIAADPAPKMSAEQAAAIAGDPDYTPQRLTLADLPKATGSKTSLFNGRDLSDWDLWLGFEDPGLTYTAPAVQPIGVVQPGREFSVVQEDGRAAIRVEGKTWGSLVNKRELSNYHLRAQFKWGPKTWAPRESEPPNNGLLYHSRGEPGAVFGTWTTAVEFEIMVGSTGMVVPVGTNVGVRTDAARDWSIIYPHRRYMAGGRTVDVAVPAWNVQTASDHEKPAGEWNTLDLYVVGDRAVHVVNGVPVMQVWGLTIADKDGRRSPLTSGRIQFQSEGAEFFVRDIEVEPIAALPTVRVEAQPATTDAANTGHAGH